jgi:serine/threonine protein kinase
MPLSPGDRLGPYEIISPLGKGGMGEVWKARDSRLNRDVAIKFAAQQFSDRFEREAHAIAALNHNNICILHDIGPNYLVMELIEGPTLAERMAEGPIPLEEALGIAKQIGEALEAAHEKAIVHRDLKPANVKIRPDGSVKVLDFGLAKSAIERVEPTSDSPTMMPGTQMGMILGTAGYMSPEQARGQPADKRADIWAWGVVLWEMVTGKRLFDGPTVSDSLAAILKEQPDLTQAPEKIRRVLARCLEKDPNNRLRDISGIEFLLASSAPSRSRFGNAGWIAAGAFALIAGALAFIHFREKPPETPVSRFAILPPQDATLLGPIALSPDGRRLVFDATSKDGVPRLWVRSLDSTTAQPMPGTEGVLAAFWSPDSHSMGFTTNSKLKKIDVSGGPAVTLADTPAFRGASWSPQGVMIFASNTVGPLQRIAAAGGTAVPATAIDPASKENSHRWPWFLPDGRHFLFSSVIGGTNATDQTIYLGSLDSRETRMVAQATSNAVYADGHLLFLRDNTLMAQPFDSKRLATTGEAVPVAEQVTRNPTTGLGYFAVSATGTLVFQPGAQTDTTLVWLDRTGKRLASVGESGPLNGVRLSPDGKRAAVTVLDRATHNFDLWIYDLVRNLRSRFTFDPANDETGIWSPDGSQIVFRSQRPGNFNLYRKMADGAGPEELLYADALNKTATSWSRDGKFVMYQSSGDPKTGQDLWVLPLEGERKPIPFVKTSFNEVNGQFSPDGHWVAYTSNESGRNEIYLAPFPGTGGKHQVSEAGGNNARWRADGKELFYLTLDNRMMAAEITIKAADVEIGAVRTLFGPLPSNYVDVSADGQRFLTVMPNEQAASEPLTLVQNWPAALKK